MRLFLFLPLNGVTRNELQVGLDRLHDDSLFKRVKVHSY